MLTPGFDNFTCWTLQAGTQRMAVVSNQTVKKQRLLRWIAVPLVVLFVAFGLAIYAFAIRASAKSILKDVSALRVGVSSTAEVEAVAARHRGSLRERRCDGQRCFVAFEVYNTWLYRLKLEPIARFRAAVEVDGGTVNCIEVMLSRDTALFPRLPPLALPRNTATCLSTWSNLRHRPIGFLARWENPILRLN